MSTPNDEELKIIWGHTFPFLTNLLHEKGKTLVRECRYIAAIIVKACKETVSDQSLLLELYEFIDTYCSVVGPVIGFTAQETDFLVTHLLDQVKQVGKSSVVLRESRVPRKGVKRNKRLRADLNVDSSDNVTSNPDVQASAIQALISLLVTVPRSVSENVFKSVASVVAREVLEVNLHRYEMREEGCVYANGRNRKKLYKLLELVAKYPVFPQHRPLHIALHAFAEAASWDSQDLEYSIPTFCRNSLITLELIVDPIISPHVLQPDPSVGVSCSSTLPSPMEVLERDKTDEQETDEITVVGEVNDNEAVCNGNKESLKEPLVPEVMQSESPDQEEGQTSKTSDDHKGEKETQNSNEVREENQDEEMMDEAGDTTATEADVTEICVDPDLITLSDDSNDELLIEKTGKVPNLSQNIDFFSPRTHEIQRSFEPVIQELKSVQTRSQVANQNRERTEVTPVSEPMKAGIKDKHLSSEIGSQGKDAADVEMSVEEIIALGDFS